MDDDRRLAEAFHPLRDGSLWSSIVVHLRFCLFSFSSDRFWGSSRLTGKSSEPLWNRAFNLDNVPTNPENTLTKAGKTLNKAGKAPTKAGKAPTKAEAPSAVPSGLGQTANCDRF